jgi:tetratricopeptide (TPR) repeat protein
MKFKKVITVTISLSLFFSLFCLAQEAKSLLQSNLTSVSIKSSPLNQQIANYWFQRKEYLLKGDLDSAKEMKTNIIDLLMDKNITSFPSLSASFLTEGENYLAKGNIEYAINSFQAAIEVDPYSSPAYYSLAKAYLKQKKGNFFKYTINIIIFLRRNYLD